MHASGSKKWWKRIEQCALSLRLHFCTGRFLRCPALPFFSPSVPSGTLAPAASAFLFDILVSVVPC